MAVKRQPTCVVNIKAKEEFDVYIGRAVRFAKDPRCRRGTVWRNPFKVTADLSPAAAVKKYRKHIAELLNERPELRAELRKMKGKRLGCWCKPAPCHGDVLIELIDGIPSQSAARRAESHRREQGVPKSQPDNRLRGRNSPSTPSSAPGPSTLQRGATTNEPTAAKIRDLMAQMKISVTEALRHVDELLGETEAMVKAERRKKAPRSSRGPAKGRRRA